MKIVRDGIEIELTYAEKYEAYRQCKRELLIEDIRNKAIEMEVDLEGASIDYIADKAERATDNNDYLWESYWMDVEYAIDEVCGDKD